MPTVEIKGFGIEVEFPDSMTDDEITAALRDRVMPQLQQERAASDRQALEAMTPYERAQVLERHRNGGAQTVGEAMTQLSGAAPAVSPPAGALTSTPEGAAPGSRSFGQAVRDTGHNALVALGEPARGRLSLPGLQVVLQGLATLPVPGANPAAGLMAYDRAAAAVLPEDVRPAPEGAGAWERALTETALPSLAAFADPANMGAMIAGGAAAAPVAGALGLGEVLASPVASAAGKAAARAMQAGLGGAGALGAFGGVEAAQRGESPAGIALAAGKSAATGLELGATAGMPGGALGKLLGEVGIFGLAAPAMEGRMPTEDDLVGAIVMIGGLNAARGLSPGAIRGLLKRREDRTPEESQAVEAIPPEQMQAVVEELAQRDPGLATIHRAERIAREEPTRYQVQEAGGVPKATPLPRETPDQTKRLLAQVPDDVLLSELAREQQSDSRRRLLQEEFYHRTAAPEPEPQGEINQADILARQKKGRRLALAQSPTRSVTVGALKAGDRVKTVQGDGKVVKVTQNGVKVVTDAGATVSLFRGQRVRRYGEASGAGAPEFSQPQARPQEPRPLETAMELQDYQEIVDLVPERRAPEAARAPVSRETPAEPAAPPVEPTPAPEVPAPDSGIAEVATRIIGARETPPAPWATTRATDGREMRVSLVTKAGDDVVYSTVGGRSLRTDGGSRYREILLIDEESDYSTTHWQEPGVLAHMRVSEFPDKSLLLIDEAQSDWASDARKGKAAKYPLSGTEWQRLLLTRAIQEAKASGLDHVGWVTGETTSARYNLEAAKEPVARGKYSRWVDNLGPDFPPDGGRVDFELFRGVGGGFSLDLYAKRGDGERVLVADESIPLNADALREYVGSAHAEKLAAEALEMAGEIGAERWAANLYDKSLPSVAKKLTGAEPSIIDIDGERVHAINLRDARKPLPALPQAASEAPPAGKVPAPAAEGPQGAAEAPLPKKGDRMEVASRFGDVRVGDKGSVVKAWVVKKGERAGNRYVTLDFGATRDGKRIRNTYPENVLRAAEATPAPAEAPKPKRRVLKAAKPEPPESSQAGRLEDPTEVVPPAEGREGFLSVGGGPAKRVPWLNKARAKVSNPRVEAFFERTGDTQNVGRRLRGVGQKIKTGLSERFKYLPKLPGDKYAEARDEIRTMQDEVRLSGERAVEDVSKVLNGDKTVGGVTPEGLEVLGKKVFLEDFLQDAKDGKEVPGGLTEAEIVASLAEMDAVAAKVPSVQEAYKRRQSLWEKVTQDLLARGVISEEAAKRPTYIRHFVLEHLGPSSGGPRKKLTEPYRGYGKQRKGTTKDISTDFIEAEVRALADIYRDNAIQDAAERLAAKYGITVKKGDPIPAGYAEWRYRRGNLLYQATTIPEAKMAKLLQSAVTDPALGKVLQVPEADLREVLVMGGKRKTFIVPSELAAQLENLPVNERLMTEVNFSQATVQGWKRWILRTNPVRYNVRNMIGDAERVNAAGLAGAFLKVKQAAQELTAKTGDTYEAFRRLGVIGSGRFGLYELGDAKRQVELERFAKVDSFKSFVRAARRRAGDPLEHIDSATQARENLLRYAVGLEALARVDAFLSGKTPHLKHLAGSQSEIEALARADRYRAAAKISRETLGDYGKFTPWENARLRNGWMPFYSWMKINTTFWPKVLKESAVQGGKGKAVGAAAGHAAIGLAGWTARIGAGYAALAIYNRRDERTRAIEAAQPWYIRTRPHIITDDGSVIMEPSAFSDFTEWFGTDEIAMHMSRFERGEITMKELLREAMMTEVQAPLNRIFQAGSPFPKAILTLAGVKTFPDLFEVKFFAKPFSDKSTKAAVLDILGLDVKRFVDAAQGDRTWGEVLAYYFSGNAYRPMTAEELAAQIDSALKYSTTKKGAPRKGREAEASDLKARKIALERARMEE